MKVLLIALTFYYNLSCNIMYVCMLCINVLACVQTDEFLARHLEEKARMRQAQQEEKRKVLFSLYSGYILN